MQAAKPAESKTQPSGEDDGKNGFNKSDMKLFDQWAAEPKPEPKPMSKKERIAMYGDQKWRLTQVQQGGNDTVATNLYPEHFKDNATVAKPRKEVTWKESTSQKDSSSWKDSTSWRTSTSWKEKQETPSSSSASWKQSSWQARGWQDKRESQSNWPSAPWNQDENQWKRRKW